MNPAPGAVRSHVPNVENLLPLTVTCLGNYDFWKRGRRRVPPSESDGISWLHLLHSQALSVVPHNEARTISFDQLIWENGQNEHANLTRDRRLHEQTSIVIDERPFETGRVTALLVGDHKGEPRRSRLRRCRGLSTVPTRTARDKGKDQRGHDAGDRA